MNAKEYLNQLVTMDCELKRKLQRLQNLKTVALSVSPNYDGEVVQRTREKSHLENVVVKILDLEREIEGDVEALANFRVEVWDILDKLSDERHKKILWMEFSEQRSGAYIADDLKLSPRHVRRLKSQAMESFEKIFEKIKMSYPCPIDVRSQSVL